MASYTGLVRILHILAEFARAFAEGNEIHRYFLWEDTHGNTMPISDMDDTHLSNAIHWGLRNFEELDDHRKGTIAAMIFVAWWKYCKGWRSNPVPWYGYAKGFYGSPEGADLEICDGWHDVISNAAQVWYEKNNRDDIFAHLLVAARNVEAQDDYNARHKKLIDNMTRAMMVPGHMVRVSCLNMPFVGNNPNEENDVKETKLNFNAMKKKLSNRLNQLSERVRMALQSRRVVTAHSVALNNIPNMVNTVLGDAVKFIARNLKAAAALATDPELKQLDANIKRTETRIKKLQDSLSEMTDARRKRCKALYDKIPEGLVTVGDYSTSVPNNIFESQSYLWSMIHSLANNVHRELLGDERTHVAFSGHGAELLNSKIETLNVSLEGIDDPVALTNLSQKIGEVDLDLVELGQDIKVATDKAQKSAQEFNRLATATLNCATMNAIFKVLKKAELDDEMYDYIINQAKEYYYVVFDHENGEFVPSPKVALDGLNANIVDLGLDDMADEIVSRIIDKL